MQENLEVFDFELAGDELAQIAAMERGESLFFDHRDPEWVALIGTRPIV